MRFAVKYTNRAGDVLLKDWEGASADEVAARVLAEGSFPLEVKASGRAFRRVRTLRTDSLIILNQELLALLRAGIPLLQCLELLAGHGKDPLLRRSLERVMELVKEGLSFSEALEQAGTFPSVYRANIVAGERSGTLPEVIARWLAFQEFAQKSRRRILEAMIYPMFLVAVLGVALVVIFNVVLPRFSEIYSDGSIEMPGVTRMLLAFGAFMRETVWIQVGLLGALAVFLRWMFATEAGKRILERGLLALPRFGTLYRMYHSSVFARTLGVLLAGGMPVLQSLEVIQRTTPSERMKLRLVKVAELVRGGSSLHQALERSRMLDPLAVEMTRVGEQSSALPDMLNHVADFFDQEVEKATTAITTLIGPALILFMGVVVLGLLLAVYVPLFNAGNMVR
ncbi:MAG TPA: type II secretion system F family protein [Holophaga sp.]|nr:type II secretion system F family protein [Holophaga sp.]HPS67224.1 type II secretion system F family protein [Holophaga sp.]